LLVSGNFSALSNPKDPLLELSVLLLVLLRGTGQIPRKIPPKATARITNLKDDLTEKAATH
jgi:hypothetical protein